MYKKGKILVVKLDSGPFFQSHEALKMDYSDNFLRAFLGGRGFNSALLYLCMAELNVQNKLPPDWESEENIVCISGGMLAGTSFPSSGRTTISVLKSPVTGMFADGNLGGHFGPALRLVGIDAIVIVGRSETPVSIFIDAEGEVSFIRADLYRDYGVSGADSALSEQLSQLYSRKVRTVALTMGYACFNAFCGIPMSSNRAAGGGGTGSVLASKGIKSIAVEHDKIAQKYDSVEVHNMKAFLKICQRAEKHIKSHPVYNVFKTYGTTSLVEIHAGLNYFPTNNWMKSNFEKWTSISGEALKKDNIRKFGKDRYENLIRLAEEEERLGCRNCPILCSDLSKVEYETLNCLGAKLGISDLSWIQRINNVYLNDAGMDVIQSTSCLSALLEMVALNVYMPTDERATFGNKEYAEQFLKDLATGETLTYEAGFFFNGFEQGINDLYEESPERFNLHRAKKHFSELVLKHCSTTPIGKLCLEAFYVGSKRNGLSGVYISRKTKGVALSTATSTRGADHLRSLPTLATYASWYIGQDKRSFSNKAKSLVKALFIPWKASRLMRSDSKTLVGSLWDTYRDTFGVPESIVEDWKQSGFLFNEKQNEGWGLMVKYTQEAYAAADALSTCKFTTSWRFGVGPIFQATAVVALTGMKSFTWQDILAAGARITALERDILVGMSNGSFCCVDTVSKKFFTKVKKPLSEFDLQEMLSDFYKHCGYRPDGSPSIHSLAKIILQSFTRKDYDIAKTAVCSRTDSAAGSA